MHGANQRKMARFGGEQVFLLVICWIKVSALNPELSPDMKIEEESIQDEASAFLASPLVAMGEVRLDMVAGRYWAWVNKEAVDFSRGKNGNEARKVCAILITASSGTSKQ